MPYRWSLRVEDSFQITGRGLVVVGTFDGIGQQEDPAQVDAGDNSFRIDRVWFEVLTANRQDRPAILLGPLDKSQVPIGALVHSVDKPQARAGH
jgi:hypothetical protein